MAGMIPTARGEAIKAGAVRYNDGSTCARGHRADRFTKNGACMECSRENNRRYMSKKAGDHTPYRSTADQTDPETQEISMTLSQQWQYVGPYRYAVEYNGHTLQTAPNPERDDKRKYLAVVNRVPVDGPCWSLNEAKTKAIKAVQRKLAGKKADRVFSARLTAQAAPFPTDAPQPPAADPAPIGAAQAADQLAAEALANADALFGDLSDLDQQPVEVRAPEPAPAPQMIEQVGAVETLPAMLPRPGALRAVFTVEVQGYDTIAALTALQSAADLLRSLGHVDCKIDLPASIQL